MRKIISASHITFDGVMSGREGDEDNMAGWAMPGIIDSTPEFQGFLKDFGTILLGRVTYQGLSQFWPSQDGEFADLMNHAPKIVFSTTLSRVEWGDYRNISLISEEVEMKVKRLKEQDGKDMVIFASSKLVQSLTNFGLIDEYRIVQHPVLLGSGKRLFDGIAARQDLRLESVKPYPSGALLLRYVAASSGKNAG